MNYVQFAENQKPSTHLRRYMIVQYSDQISLPVLNSSKVMRATNGRVLPPLTASNISSNSLRYLIIKKDRNMSYLIQLIFLRLVK